MTKFPVGPSIGTLIIYAQLVSLSSSSVWLFCQICKYEPIHKTSYYLCQWYQIYSLHVIHNSNHHRDTRLHLKSLGNQILQHNLLHDQNELIQYLQYQLGNQ